MSDTSEQHDVPARRFVRTRERRLVGGVCSGLGSQFGVDPLLIRIAFVGLTFFGGAGFWLYLAILLLVPEEGASRAPIRVRRSSLPLIAGVIALVAAAGIALSTVDYESAGSAPALGAACGLLAVFSLVARYARRRLRSRSAGTPQSADLRLAVNLALATTVTAETALLALAGAWLAGIDERAAAWAVVAVGAALVACAFLRVRRVLVPALAFALAVAVFAAAGVDLHGGFGERVYRPHTLGQLRTSYRLGAGRLEIDLRDLAFPAGITSMRVRLGVGEAVVVVPDEVCVATRARVGGGFVGALDRETGGLDVNWSARPTPPMSTRVLMLEGSVGLGALMVVDRPLAGNFQPGLYGTNAACRAALGVTQ
jgi:phage shock protein PspC (stress-responsive transcriptional regulator)